MEKTPKKSKQQYETKVTTGTVVLKEWWLLIVVLYILTNSYFNELEGKEFVLNMWDSIQCHV